MELTKVQTILKAEKIELESMKAACLPYKGLLPADGNIYCHEFSPGCLILICANDFLFGNRVLGAGIENGLTNELIKDLKAFFKAAKIQRFLLQACPVVINEESVKIISESGGSLVTRWIKLFKHTGEISPVKNNIIIREIEEDDKDFVSRFLIESFSFPTEIMTFCKNALGKNGWTSYVAMSGDKIGGTGSVYVEGKIAELAIAATVTSERRKGIQSALIAARELYAIEKKCEYIFVETGEPTPEILGQSYLNLIRLGYKELYKRGNYIFQL